MSRKVRHRNSTDFLAGGGEMGALIRAHDWASTALGPPGSWPQPLKTVIRLILNTRHPMYVFWGPELRCFYNDAYRPSIGPERHSSSLGRPAREVWDEIWDVIGPQIEQVMSGGGATWHENQLIPITRRGKQEDVYWTYSYGPIDDEAALSGVGGVLVVCTETTDQVLAGQVAEAALRRLGRMFEQAPGAVAILQGPNHVFEFVNPAYVALIGRRPVLGATVAEVLPEVVAQGFIDLLDRVYTSGEAHVGRAVPVVLQRRTGTEPETRILDFVYQPLADASGHRVGILVEATDVTETARAVAGLREREERLRLIIEGARDYAIITTDLERRVTSWSTGAEAAFGRSDAAMLGNLLDQIFTPEDRAAGVPEKEVEAAARDGRADDERWHLRADGSRVFMSGVVRPLPRDEQERQRGFIKIARDETRQRLQAEALIRTREELVASESRYRLLFDSIDAGFCVIEVKFDQDSRAIDYQFIETNPAFATQTGLPHALGRWMRDLAPDHEPYWFDIYGKVALTGEPARFESEAAALGRWYDVQAYRVGAPDQRRVAVLFNDITARKLAERELRQLNATLESRVIERTDELLAAQNQVHQMQKLDAIGQLTGGVAHDFNNLLTVIRSAADLLRRRDVTEEKRRQYVDAISDTADRAARLTGQLLAFARRQTLKPEVFDVSARIRGITEMLRTVVGPRVRLQVEERCDACFVEADTSQFETALVNMAANARDAMDGEGDLLFRVSKIAGLPASRGLTGKAGEFVALAVSDSGRGIPPENLTRIFEPFFTTKEIGRGTGLGLSQVYGFAKQSGGEVDVESVPGGRTTFTLYLPRAAAPSAELADPTPDLPKTPERKRVLLVEDNRQVGGFVTQLLSDLGYETRLAGSGAEALDLLGAADARFDLVFSDVVMPSMTGVELGREIQARWPHLPIVLTSGYSHVLAEDSRHGFPLLRKPYSIDELSRMLHDAITTAPRP